MLSVFKKREGLVELPNSSAKVAFDGQTFSVSIEAITPEIARTLLDTSIGNRPTIKRNLSKIMTSLKSNEWDLNGEAIKISDTGKLLDGHQRLEGVVKSGITINTFVIRGMKESTFVNMDSGSSRTLSHTLAINGESNYSILAPAISLIHNYKQGAIPVFNGGKRPSVNVALKFIEEHPGISKSTSFTKSSKHVKKWLTPSFCAFLHAIFNELSPADCESFFHKLETGELLEKKDPIYPLREKLISISSVSATKRIAPVERSAHCIIAWNAFRGGKKITAADLKWNTDDSNRTFPIAV